MKFDIRDFGAYQSDRTVTKEIQAAIDACHAAGGGEVIIPAGIFRVGMIWLRSNVTLHLERGAVLEGSERCEDYENYPADLSGYEHPYTPGRICGSIDPYSNWNRAIIKAIGAENIAIIGEEFSYIDGSDCYDGEGEENYRGPHPINLTACKSITLRGYTVRRGGNWGHAIFDSENIKISGVSVFGGHDGIDIFRCVNVEIRDCVIHSGDDCIAGYGSKGVLVERCEFSTACSVFRFGGTDVLARECHQIAGPARYSHRFNLTEEEKSRRVATSDACRRNAHNAFLYYCDQRFPVLDTPGNIVIEDSVFESSDSVFRMDFGNHIWCCHTPLKSITFRRCKHTNLIIPTLINGSTELPFVMRLEDVELSAHADFAGEAVIEAKEFSELWLDGVRFHGFTAPRIITSGKGKIYAENTDGFVVAMAK